MSEKMRRYFERIKDDINVIYDVANKARAIGIDPEPQVESPQAMDMAGRVEKLVGPNGVAARIRELQEQELNQDAITFKIADEVIEERFGSLNLADKADLAIRVALAIKTEGVVSAPLEGIGKIEIRKDAYGGPDYLAVYFAGPIRAAGGTVQAYCVLIADHVREKLKIAPYVPTEEEVGRMIEEIKLYDRIMRLQYPSTIEELEFAVRNLRVELNGEPTEDREVSAYRDLKRINTNRVRGGPCLVINDGILLKAKKLLKVIDKRNIEGWKWLHDIKKYSQKSDEDKKKTDEAEKTKEGEYGGGLYDGKQKKESEIKNQEIRQEDDPVTKRKKMLEKKFPPRDKFIADIIAGRPVFAYPSAIGGHRIRYGRSRNTGLAACGFHPSTMYLLEKFLAVGTQIRIERPGKSGSVMPVTSIEPPIVLMKNGEVKQLWNINEAKQIAEARSYDNILFLGDILFGYGEFAENNHVILPSGYVEEWWSKELKEAVEKAGDTIEPWKEYINNPFKKIPNIRTAIEISLKYHIGLHPRYTDHWGNLNGIDSIKIRNQLKMSFQKIKGITDPDVIPKFTLEELEQQIPNDGLEIPADEKIKEALLKVFFVHTKKNDSIIISKDRAILLAELYGFGMSRIEDENWKETETRAHSHTALELFKLMTKIDIRDKAPYYMGTRMGRPEKAKERKMNPPTHVLFPLGHDSENRRVVNLAAKQKSVKVEIAQKYCPKCNHHTFLNKCEKCGGYTEFHRVCNTCQKSFPLSEERCDKCNGFLSNSAIKELNVGQIFSKALEKFNISIPTVKGVKGLNNLFKSAEPIEKGILRAMNEVYVFKDGTIRFDSTDIPFTHFTCEEIGITPEDAIRLGYDVDIYGKPITEPNQVIELKCQDIIITDHCAEYFMRVAKFVDDELEYLYNQPRFYNIKEKRDFIGQYFAGLAPHTSAAIVGRCIGFCQINSGYAHPYWHAAKRRNCDGDEDGLMLLLEYLLNFSKYYLPSSLGGKMDAPLVLSVILDPNEVDGESHNVDTLPEYPLQFYQDSLKYPKPNELESYMRVAKNYIGKPEQYEGFMFTHPTENINWGPKKSAYSELGSMEEKIESQMFLTEVINAVNKQDVARKILTSHFIPDLMGNMRSFSTQTFRCIKCGTKFRRIPLSGKCTECEGKVVLTVTKGMIAKYLPKALALIEKYDLGNYTKQRMELLKQYILSLTDNPKVKQSKLSSFFA